jgi:hypothetical protein
MGKFTIGVALRHCISFIYDVCPMPLLLGRWRDMLKLIGDFFIYFFLQNTPKNVMCGQRIDKNLHIISALGSIKPCEGSLHYFMDNKIKCLYFTNMLECTYIRFEHKDRMCIYVIVDICTDEGIL